MFCENRRFTGFCIHQPQTTGAYFACNVNLITGTGTRPLTILPCSTCPIAVRLETAPWGCRTLSPPNKAPKSLKLPAQTCRSRPPSPHP